MNHSRLVEGGTEILSKSIHNLWIINVSQILDILDLFEKHFGFAILSK